MLKWIIRIIVIAVVGLMGYSVIGSYQRGYFNVPDLPDGAYLFSFRGSGFRGIVLDAEVADDWDDAGPAFYRRIHFANPDRRYIGVPADVEEWFERSWSTCRKPAEGEMEEYWATLPEDWRDILTNARLDAVCHWTWTAKKCFGGCSTRSRNCES